MSQNSEGMTIHQSKEMFSFMDGPKLIRINYFIHVSQIQNNIHFLQNYMNFKNVNNGH